MVSEIKGKHLWFDGCDTVELAKEFGTPLYVFSKTDIVARIDELKECWIKPYPKNRVAYAAKAFCCMGMYKLCENQGISMDVVSGGELYTAMKAGINPAKLEFNGNNKLPKELEAAIDYGVERIVIDGVQELELIESICRKLGKKTDILIRVTPCVEVDTHDFIVTGRKDSKFGLNIEPEFIFPYVKRAIESEYVNFHGFHFHLGSQLFDVKPFIDATKVMLQLMKDTRERFGFVCDELNVGGGPGVTYINEERPPYRYFYDPILAEVEAFCKAEDYPMPAMICEPGRSIVAEAGLQLYTVGMTKEVIGIRKYAAIDGGMPDNIRPALYGAKYKGIVANRADEPADETVTICGKCCEGDSDMIIKDAPFVMPKTGDIIAVFSTGAYGYSMANNYNRNPIPGVVLVEKGKAEWMVKPQTYEQMICGDVIPELVK
ncbi:MAG: diaminopimelate decarboxylase [Firmicutes bacterium]|nr:diaminopimelate decarboxylase [Bacillota bacterium]